MVDFAVDTLLTKDSGGEHTAAKLDAATDLGIPVVIISRPPAGNAPTVTAVADVLPWLTADPPPIDLQMLVNPAGYSRQDRPAYSPIRRAGPGHWPADRVLGSPQVG